MELEILYQALKSPYGLRVFAPDPERAKRDFLIAKKKANDKELELLQIKSSPTAPLSEVWILHIREFTENATTTARKE